MSLVNQGNPAPVEEILPLDICPKNPFVNRRSEARFLSPAPPLLQQFREK